MSFKAIINKYRTDSFSERDKGSRFERLMQAYLKTDPQYTSRIKEVWLWEDFIGRTELGGQDTGIDLVAITYDEEYWAIQCKCYLDSATIQKIHVDTFLSTSSRGFHDVNGKYCNFSERLWIATTNHWSSNAENAIRGQQIQVSRIGLEQLASAPVDWDKLESGIHGSQALTEKHNLRLHQQEALDRTHEYFKHRNRGKLIMACGTGKTFTSLRITEKEVSAGGLALVLVPSIALLSQLLREWTAQAEIPINPICVCSDPKVSKKSDKNDSGGYSTSDLALPATTDANKIIKQYNSYKAQKNALTVVFSTYQSIDVIAKAQRTIEENQLHFGGQDELALPEFDIIICDEAHRTTGAKLSDQDESAFIKIHSDKNIKGKKRLYMTATPRLYGEESKKKAEKNNALLCSMDDVDIYGEEIYRIGFGEAVEKGLLTDYKVLILTVNENDVPPEFQRAFADQTGVIHTDDGPKLIGCINALSKLIIGDNDLLEKVDPNPMMRAVAFCQTIKNSNAIADLFNEISNEYIDYVQKNSDYKKSKIIGVSADHIDGSMNALTRNEKLSWIKEDNTDNKCKILTNVRCLSEGVDVPALDAIMFLSPRSSQVEVVQSVGRVMRKAEGKKYGYIILPVFVSADTEPDKALDDNKTYQVVWQVLNALRAHDDRFNATVNQIDLNKKRPDNILIGRPIPDDYDGTTPFEIDEGVQLALQNFQTLQDAIYARLVLKVGDRRYWEDWAKRVAGISERNVALIKKAVEAPDKKEALNEFVHDLQSNINDSITHDEAVEMLSQHLVTQPIFEALFEGYSFASKNPVSSAMQRVIDKIGIQNSEENKADWESLSEFYESVRSRASGIDNNEGKQKVVIELYNTFFKTAFPKMVERLGIVYTPVEVVDFIIHSVNDVLKQEFGRDLSSENVNILDPFTGTGTFITRLLQSGLIRREDMARKYGNEIFANEIVLLAYYIAAVNIENVYHDTLHLEDYQPFEGICLTDTFQTAEHDIAFSGDLQHNTERIQKQKNAAITVIMGNPPYSVGQKSANDNAQNQAYPLLNSSIAETYAALSEATNKNALYDSYIRAFRYATDRLRGGDGIICFVSNGAWLDGNSTAGFRKSLEQEFDKIYVFNLRGNARTSGELRRKEKDNVFGQGTRTTITITLLLKKQKSLNQAKIYYCDIGDYLTRKQKLDIIKQTSSFLNSNLSLVLLTPNEYGDWITTRNKAFDTFLPLVVDNKVALSSNSFFIVKSNGMQSNRDVWVYNFSKLHVCSNMEKMSSFYNNLIDLNTEFPDNDPTKISWSSSLLSHYRRREKALFNKQNICTAMYRPFNKQYLYFGDKMIHRRGQFGLLLPSSETENIFICTSSVGDTYFSAFISNCMIDLHTVATTQCFPLYYYQKLEETSQMNLFEGNDNSNQKYIRHSGISDFIHKRAQQQYGTAVTKEDIFFYVYGFLHSPDYRETFADDLKKSLPCIPLVDRTEDFWAFSKAGRELAQFHLYYEEISPLADIKVVGNQDDFKVQKMKFFAKGRKDSIIYNDHIVVENIPEKAYEYVINGKSAIEWIMERYQIRTDKASGILNDPNLYAEEIGNPRYILDLLLSVISVSVQTVDIVAALPKIRFE